MRRRRFLLLAGAASVAPLWTAAAAPAPLVGVVLPLSAAADSRYVEALRNGLGRLGYVEGRNITYAIRFAGGVTARMPALVAELLALKPAVLVSPTTPGMLAAHAATHTIPIVMVTINDAVALGVASSLSRPGGNVTGVWMSTDEALIGKRLQILKDAAPGNTRIGVVANPDDKVDAVIFQRLPALARQLGLEAHILEVRTPAEFDHVASAAAAVGAQGLFISHSPLFMSHRAAIVADVGRTNLPAIYGFPEFADDGGLVSYGPNLSDVYRLLASLVDKILKGRRPADLPIEIPTRFELSVNLKTARSLGIAVPQSILLRADEVIE